MAHSHVSRAGHHAYRAAKRARQALLEEVKDRGGELIEEAQGRGRRALKSSEEWIVENPVSAVAVAFAAGALLSSLLRRREG